MLQVKGIVGKLLSSNMYLLYEECNANSYLIDIGDSSALVEELPNDIYVRGVFITHSHFDHIAGINDLCRIFPECRIFTSEYGKQALYSNKKNFSFYHQQSTVYEGDNITILHEGDCIPIFDDESLYVAETPGHCPSCLTYYTSKYIFTGDSYIPNSPVITKLPRGDKFQADISIEKIKRLSVGRCLCAGHDKDKWISLFDH